MNIDTTETTQTTEPAIGYIPCYRLPLFKCKTCMKEFEMHYFVQNKKLKNGIEHQCKSCRKKYYQQYKKENKAKIKEYFSKRLTKEYYLERRKTENYKNQRKRKREKEKENLEKGYLRVQLYNKGIKTDNITPEILEIQKIIIKTKRLCKTLKN